MMEAEKRRAEAERRFYDGQLPRKFKHLWKNVEILRLEEGGAKVVFYGDDLVWLHGDATIKKIEIKLSQPVLLSLFSEWMEKHGLAMALWYVLALNGIVEFPRVRVEGPEILVKWEEFIQELKKRRGVE